jgi:hypothetical protein
MKYEPDVDAADQLMQELADMKVLTTAGTVSAARRAVFGPREGAAS